MPADSRCEKIWNCVWIYVWNCGCKSVQKCRWKTFRQLNRAFNLAGMFLGVFRFTFHLELKTFWGNFVLQRCQARQARSTLASHFAVPRGTNVARMNAIAWFESRHNRRKVYEDYLLCFGDRYNQQRMLVIQIATITLASIRENQTCTKSWSPLCVAFTPFSPGGIGPFPVAENPLFRWEVLLFLQDAHLSCGAVVRGSPDLVDTVFAYRPQSGSETPP